MVLLPLMTEGKGWGFDFKRCRPLVQTIIVWDFDFVSIGLGSFEFPPNRTEGAGFMIRDGAKTPLYDEKLLIRPGPP